MQAYYCTVEKINEDVTARIICYARSEADVVSTVFEDFLSDIRKRRYRELVTGCSDKSAEGLRNHLPPEFRKYANNKQLLKEAMASMYEVSHMYSLSNIELAPQCFGCLNNRPGQRDHMECPTGCLHNKDYCHYC